VKDLCLNPINKDLFVDTFFNPSVFQTYASAYLTTLDAAQTSYTESNLSITDVPTSGEITPWFELGFFWAITARRDILSFANVNRVMVFHGPGNTTAHLSMGYNPNFAGPSGGFLKIFDGTISCTIRNANIIPSTGSIINRETYKPNIIWSYKKAFSQVVTFGSNSYSASYDVTNYKLQNINYRATGINGTVNGNNSSGIIWGESVFYLGDRLESSALTCLDYMMKKWTGVELRSDPDFQLTPPPVIA
jgi:hypothetical protein